MLGLTLLGTLFPKFPANLIPFLELITSPSAPDFVHLMVVGSKVPRLYLSTGELRQSMGEPKEKKLQACCLVSTHRTPQTHPLPASRSRHSNHSREVQMNQLQDSRTLSTVLFVHFGKITRHRRFWKTAKLALRHDTPF